MPPAEHAAFYAAQAWTLNLTRADMRRLGHSPSVRLFEAGACATPIISDDWPGLAGLFKPGRDIILARSAEDVLAALEMPEPQRAAIAKSGRARTLARHAAAVRAAEFEGYLAEAGARRR